MKLLEVAHYLGAELIGDGDLECQGIKEPAQAGPHDLAYLDTAHAADLSHITAAALILDKKNPRSYANRLLVDNPQLAFCRALELFYPHISPFPGISEQAVISPSARLAKGVSVGAFSVIGDHVMIGEETEIHPQVVIYPGVHIGKRCRIYAGAVVREGCDLADEVIVQPGAIIGADGFGYVMVAGQGPRKIPQIGIVQIEGQVEIGANSCVDRGTLSATRLAEQVKLDNLVQVAHNVTVGARTRLSAQTGISGSVQVGADVVMGGQVGVADHVSIADGTMVAAQAGISGSVKEKTVLAGSPHQEIGSWRRSYVLLRNLDKYIDRMKELEKRVKELEHEQ